jgi:RNA polymerase sigma factor (sigma-70 family)
MDDRLLTIQYRCGSRRALRHIYVKYKRDLLLVALGLLNDTALAEDVVHDVFVRFAEQLAGFRLTGSLKGYLLTCTVNQARNVLKARKRRLKISILCGEDESVASPLDHLICNEQAKKCAATLAQLPMEQREVILLHMQGQLSLARIAKRLALPVNTVKSRYRYGIAKLRLIFEEQLGQSYESGKQTQAHTG